MVLKELRVLNLIKINHKGYTDTMHACLPVGRDTVTCFILFARN
jgi:hypothetical protein